MRDGSEKTIIFGVVATLLSSWMIWVTTKLADVSERTARIDERVRRIGSVEGYPLDYEIKRNGRR